MNNTSVAQNRLAAPLREPTANACNTPIETQKAPTLFTLKPQTQTRNTKNTLPSLNTIDIPSLPSPSVAPHSSSNLASLPTLTNLNINNANYSQANQNNHVHFNGHNNPTNIDINGTNGALFKSPDHLNNLMKTFGRPSTMSEFNIMAIAGVLQEGNHIHKNRELQATVKRFKHQMGDQQQQIKILHEKVKIYKDEAEKYERLEIKHNEVMQLNANLVSHNMCSKKETAKLRQKMKMLANSTKQHQIHYPNTDNTTNSQTGNDIDIDLVQPLPVNIDEPHTDILAPDNNHNHQIPAKPVEQPEHKPASSWLRNQRLIQLTGDQTYMTAHQKVIKDAKHKKSHQSYQRKESFKSIQAENKSLKDQIVQISEELEEARALQGGLTEDGVSADYLKAQLGKVRDELEQEKKITSKFKVALHSSDGLQTVKISLANSQSALERLKIRYEKSKQRVENLATETENAKKLKDAVVKERDEMKEKTKSMISNARDHIVKISNECEMYKKEVLRLTRENKKLLQRESLEAELNAELAKMKKQCKHTESQCKKHKKRYKDLKLQADASGVAIRSKKGRKRGRAKKNEVFLSSDSEEKERVKQTVKLMKKWERTQKKESKRVVRIRTDDILKDIDHAIEKNAQVDGDGVGVADDGEVEVHGGNESESEIEWSDENEVIFNNVPAVDGGNEITPTYLAQPPPMSMAVSDGDGDGVPPVGIPVDVPVSAPVAAANIVVSEERIGSPTSGVMGYGSVSSQMLPIQSNVDVESVDNAIICQPTMHLENVDGNVEEMGTNESAFGDVSNVNDNVEQMQNNDGNGFVNDVSNMGDNFEANNDGDDEDDGSDFVDHDLAEISTVNDLFISTHPDPDPNAMHSTDNSQVHLVQTPNTDDDSVFGIGSSVSGIDSPCQNPIVSSSQTNPFMLNQQNNNEGTHNSVAAPLMLHDSAADDPDEDIQKEAQTQQVQQQQQRDNIDASSRSGNNENGPQPLFVYEGGVTSDSSDADHSDRSNQNFLSPIHCQPEPLFADPDVDNTNDNLFDNGQPTQILEPDQEADDDDEDDGNDDEQQTEITEIVSTPKEKSISFELEVGLQSAVKPHSNDNNMDDNYIKMEHDPNQEQPININANNRIYEPHNNDTASIKMEDDTNTKKRQRDITDFDQEILLIINEPLSKKRKLIENNSGNNLPNLEKTFTDNANPFGFKKRNNNIPHSTCPQFIDWKDAFSHLITQKAPSLIDSCINNMLQRWKSPQCECDQRHSCKDIAGGILDIIVLQKYDVICPNGSTFFAAHNKTTYLSLLRLLCDIITKLNNGRCALKDKTLMIEILKCCKKIINKTMYPNLKNKSIIYLMCGLVSILCKHLKDEGRFWRQMLGMMTQFELHFCADIFCIMLECYPSQICAHKDAFVMNCFKYIFLSHSQPILSNNNITNADLIKVKQCYQRLSNVVNGKWNYILSSSRDDILVTQLNEYISNGYLDDDKSGDTFNGITMICGCDIRYAINHFLPNILYPILYKQFEHNNKNNNNANSQCVVFLVDLYFSCINRVYKRLKKCNPSQKSQCDAIRNDISLIMESVLILSIHVNNNNNTAVPIAITLCCLNNLFKIKKNEYIEDILFSNVHCDQQLLTFVTKLCSEWTRRIRNDLTVQSDTHREQCFFNAFLRITANVFKRKSYNIEAFESLKTQYT